MILSKKRITEALISLRGCPGWSAPLLLANPEDRFSRVAAHMIKSVKNGLHYNESLSFRFFQMAIQLAYYRMYEKCVKTYESASTR